MDFVHLHFALEWLSWAFNFHFLIWKCFFIKMEKEARYCKRDPYLFFLRSIRFDIVAEMMCCMYLKWFEWATWLSLSVIYIHISCPSQSFPQLSPIWTTSELPQQPPKKNNKKVATENGAPWASQQTMSHWKEPRGRIYAHHDNIPTRQIRPLRWHPLDHHIIHPFFP